MGAFIANQIIMGNISYTKAVTVRQSYKPTIGSYLIEHGYEHLITDTIE